MAAQRGGLLAGAMRLGSVLGIEIRLHFTVLIIFGLIFFSLGGHTFRVWHPDWSEPLLWGLAFATAVLFFISLLAHELAHSVVAQARGLEIRSITLFLFGGMAEMKTPPDSPSTEFLVAIAGPLMSVLIGIGSLLIASLLLPAGFLDQLAEDPLEAFASVGPLATLLLWLGPINLFLAVFNMVPGFPLDGGRVLRSILWAVSGDMKKATRWASNSGKGVAFTLMALGVLAILYGGLIDGLWLMLIAWFLYAAARNAYAETVVRQRLEKLTVADLMDTSFQSVDADMRVEEFMEHKLAHSSQRHWPVFAEGQVVGTINVEQAAEVPAEARGAIKVGSIMKPLNGADVIAPELHGQEALRILSDSDEGVLLVMRGSELLGTLSNRDVMRWLTLFTDDARA
jgi:Zn-dependent protease/predicted transcriptional regulator